MARWLTGVLITALVPRPAAGAQQLTFTPYHANGIYAVHERVGWRVAVTAGQAAAGPYAYTLKRDGLAVIGTGTLDLSAGHGIIETSLEQPGMLVVEVRPPAGTTGFHGASKSEVGRVDAPPIVTAVADHYFASGDLWPLAFLHGHVTSMRSGAPSCAAWTRFPSMRC